MLARVGFDVFEQTRKQRKLETLSYESGCPLGSLVTDTEKVLTKPCRSFGFRTQALRNGMKPLTSDHLVARVDRWSQVLHSRTVHI